MGGGFRIGAFIIRIGFGGILDTIVLIRNPPRPYSNH